MLRRRCSRDAPADGGLYGGGGTTVVVVNGRRLQGAKCTTVLDTMRGMPMLSDLTALVPSLSDKMQSALSSTDGPDLTMLAPSNSAFSQLKSALPPPAYDMLMRNGTMLTALLSYSIVPGQRIGSDHLGGASLRTALGDAVAPLAASGTSLQGIGSRADIVKGDVQACHATLHVVDRVLFPIPLPSGDVISGAADKMKSAVTQG